MDSATIFCIAQLPDWPPTHPYTIMQATVGATTIEIRVEVDGAFYTHINDSSEVKIFRHARVIFTDSPVFILSLTWDGITPSLRLNNTEILIDPISNNTPPTTIETTKIDPADLPPAITPKAPGSATTAEEFFIRTLADLQELSASRDRYKLIRASALLRQLLLDDLFNRANATARIKPSFRTNNFLLPPSIRGGSHWQNLSPRHIQTATLLNLNFKEFLQAPCIWINDKQVTVRDVIRACANASGGVHLAPAKNDNEKLVLELNQILVTLDLDPSIVAIRALSEIVIEGLLPLVIAIQTRNLSA